MFFNAIKRHLILAVVLLLPIVIITTAIIRLSNGFFTYTLDDPYIHLALAKNIFLGNYGINLTEPSAPSSSIIWPFVLAPFSIFQAVFELIPLFINSICLILSGLCLAILFSKQKFIIITAISLAIILSLNLYGLVFTGMEHSLQVLLVLVVTCGLMRPELINKHQSAKYTMYFCLFLLPLVRYEGLAISIPVLAYLFAKGERKLTLISLLSMLFALVAFSFYLYSNELGWLPSSVIAKTSNNNASSVLNNLFSNIKKYRALIVFVLIIACWQYYHNRALSITLVSVTILHCLFGKHGWYGRYEVYYLAFVVTIGLYVILNKSQKFWLIVLTLPLYFFKLMQPTFTTPLASSNIYNQQAQMAGIAKMLNEKIAVNDLGLVALRTNNYVLDLWGLGSIEALNNRRLNSKDNSWIFDIMQKNNVEYAFVYDDWFKDKPLNWIKVAELNLLQKRITPASSFVALYATSPDAAVKLKSTVELYTKSKTSDNFNVTYLY